MARRSLKVVLFWILGAVSIYLGTLIASHLDFGLGTDYMGVFVAMMISFTLFLIGGLLWISVAIAAKKVTEE
jgi:hypothetical protein